MRESENICVSCGLCCDGTLIGFVQLDRDELPVLRELKEIEEVDGNGFFLQPCSNLGSEGCTIYAQRPTNCDKFNCHLITRVAKKELAFDAAIERLNVVRQKKEALEKQVTILPFQLKSQSFFFKILELNKLFADQKKGESSLSKQQEAFLSDLDEFNRLVSDTFGVSFY